MAENGMRGCGGSGVSMVAGGGSNEEYINGHNDLDMASENDKTSLRLNETVQKYVQDLLSERLRMENHFPLAVKLIDEALERVQSNGRLPTREQYADVYQQRTIRLSQKVHVPIKDKKFNYVGKLLGPKGNSLRRLQEETQCKIVILGRFSMKDRSREEELRNSADAKYAHLNLPLHVEISTIAPPAEAYARVAYALAEIRRYLIPDKHDDIRQEQFRELMEDPEAAKKISMRQQQQQQMQGVSHSISIGTGTGNGGGANGSRNNIASGCGLHRPKYQQQSQNYHHNDETVLFRSHNNAYHQPKPYVSATHRSNPIHPVLAPHAIVGTSPSNMVVNAANFSGRGTSMIANSNVIGGNIGHSIRYRATVPYQIIKK